MLARDSKGWERTYAGITGHACGGCSDIDRLSAYDLMVDDAIVLQDGNRLTLRLVPCDVVSRVAPADYQASAETALELARRLAEAEGPVAELEPRVEPRVYLRDGFVIDMWTYYESGSSREIPPAGYAHALERMHAGMRRIDITTPHFMDRVTDAQQEVASGDVTPELAEVDRELLAGTQRRSRRAIEDRGPVEQLLHGEPHPWNVLNTKDGPLFIDFENAVRGPVEYDLAWVPKEVSARYVNADQDLVGECRGLILAIVAACRWRREDQHPDRDRARSVWLSAVRQGPPWTAIDVVGV